MNEEIHIRAARDFEQERSLFALRAAVDRAVADAFTATAGAMIMGFLVACVRQDSLRFVFAGGFIGAAACWLKAAFRLLRLRRLLKEAVLRKDLHL